MPDVVIVGAGHAGLAASVCLSLLGIDHVVLERGEVGENWRRQRWDSFYMNTPNWTLNLPDQDYDGHEPDAFMSRNDFVALLKDYAEQRSVPLRTGIEATRATRSGNGWRLETSMGPMLARVVIVATSTYQAPSFPAAAGGLSPKVMSLGATDYRSPDRLPDGKVLVVGSGQSGMQIVEDLFNAGRDVLLAVGQAGRVPRRYRGRDLNYWYDKIGLMDRKASDLADPRLKFGGQPQIAARHTISLQKFHRGGVRLLGRVAHADGQELRLHRDLRENIAAADRHSDKFCNDVDAYIARNGATFPPDDREELDHAPIGNLDSVSEPEALNLMNEGITSVVWATGFRFDYSWIEADVFDEVGYPVTWRGETDAPGLYFLGLNFLYTRRSGIVYGIGADARHVAARISDYFSGSAINRSTSAVSR